MKNDCLAPRMRTKHLSSHVRSILERSSHAIKFHQFYYKWREKIKRICQNIWRDTSFCIASKNQIRRFTVIKYIAIWNIRRTLRVSILTLTSIHMIQLHQLKCPYLEFHVTWAYNHSLDWLWFQFTNLGSLFVKVFSFHRVISYYMIINMSLNCV